MKIKDYLSILMITKLRKIEKRSLAQTFFLYLSVIFILAIVGFLLVANLNLYREGNGLKRKMVSLKAKVKELNRENQELKTRLSQVSQGEYTEKILREKGMYKKPGEGVVVVIRKKENQEAKKEEPNLFKKGSAVVSKGFSSFTVKISRFFEKLKF